MRTYTTSHKDIIRTDGPDTGDQVTLSCPDSITSNELVLIMEKMKRAIMTGEKK
jgi:hypothetical protein